MLRWILCWMNERYACILYSLHPVELLGRVLHVRITKGYSATTDLELWFISFTWLVVCGLLWLSLMVRLIFHNLTCHWFKSWTHITLLGSYDMVFFSKWRWLIQHLRLTPIDFLWWPIHQQWLSTFYRWRWGMLSDGWPWLTIIDLFIDKYRFVLGSNTFGCSLLQSEHPPPFGQCTRRNTTCLGLILFILQGWPNIRWGTIYA